MRNYGRLGIWIAIVASLIRGLESFDSEVEVSLLIDGVPAAASSAEFTRPPPVLMPPT